MSNLPSLTLFLLLGLAALLRFYRLDASSLWSDEGNTWAQLGRSFGAIAQAAAADIHPPGYYWLLKVWTNLFGSHASGLRSFSALTGVLLVWIIYHLGLQLFAGVPSQKPKALALLAAVLATLTPFPIYYSQEARMYVLLALVSAGVMWATFRLIDQSAGPTANGLLTPAAWVYLLCGTVGLWTHYSFPIILAAAGLGYLGGALRRRPFAWRSMGFFIALNLITLALFLPWLPTALARVLAWPKGGVNVSLWTAGEATLRTLLFGPIRTTPEPLWPWLVAGGILPLLGLWAMRRRAGGPLLALWLLAPIGLMLGLGLFSAAFLKFLLIASPAWCLASAATPLLFTGHRLGATACLTLISGGAIALALSTLPGYYTDPTARDNYAGVARYLQAVGEPASDLVILNAPGQQEVWRYYNPGLPTLALPQSRPPDPQQTIETLAAAVADRRQVYALFWATDEADPEELVEGWLDQQLFPGVESWQGNLRFVTYTAPQPLVVRPLPSPRRFGEQLELVVNEQLPPGQFAPGEVAPMRLTWRALQPIQTRYKISVQLLDGRNQVVAQQDSEPAGGALPTDGWQVGATYADQRSLFVPFGLPPGHYQLIVAVYDPATGQRLPTAQGDGATLDQLEIIANPKPIPLEIIPMQYRFQQRIGPVRLAGYNLHRKGFAHAPETPVAAGDLVHLTFYWQAPSPLPADWPTDLAFTLRLGEQTLTAPLAGGAYPTSRWHAGELVRGEFDLVYDGTARRPLLTVGGEQVRLAGVAR